MIFNLALAVEQHWQLSGSLLAELVSITHLQRKLKAVPIPSQMPVAFMIWVFPSVVHVHFYDFAFVQSSPVQSSPVRHMNVHVSKLVSKGDLVQSSQVQTSPVQSSSVQSSLVQFSSV